MEGDKGKYVGRSPEAKPLTLTRSDSCGLPLYMKSLKGGSFSVAKTIIKGHKWEHFLFFYF